MFNFFNNNDTSTAAAHTKTEEKIMDRFIPRTLSSYTYRSMPEPPDTLDDSLLNLSTTAMNEGSRALSAVPRLSTSHEMGTPQDFQKSAIRDLLEFSSDGRVLSFTPGTTRQRGHSGSGSTSGSIANSGSGSASGSFTHSSGSASHLSNEIFSKVIGSFSSPRTSFDSDISSMATAPTRFKKVIKSHMPFRVLDAPSLTNDFYTNVVSWSTKSNRIAVGLASDVYLWHEDESAYLLDLPDGHLISCVSFSEGDHIIIATKEGKFFLFSQAMRQPLDDYFNNGSGICCIAWCPEKLNGFFAGDDTGEVLYFEVDDRNKLELVSKFKCQQQQVCGIAVGYDGKQISVGGNDNSCTIWDITNIKDPKFKFHLPHQAAVKALAYCPWSRSLLATGGGSKDRTIRFWHTNSGTLLDSIQTKGQITSLIWSTRKKQITLTFGFGEAKKSKLIAVYSYPQMEELVQVEATPNLRALSAVLSPDSSSICVVANDETVRFYHLWDTKDSVIMESQEGSVFGSDLIDLCEGIAKSGGSIR